MFRVFESGTNPRALIFLVACLAALLLSAKVSARVVDEVRITDTATGYSLEVKFFTPLRYQSHSPKSAGQMVEVQLRPEGFADPTLADQFDDRSNLSWNKNSTIPLRELIFDGENVESPSLLVRFSRPVKFTVRNSPDLRSIIIELETNKWTRQPAVTKVPDVPAEDLITDIKATNPELSELLDKAGQALIDKDYRLAVQLFTKLRDRQSGAVSQRAQELLGLAREYNGQLAHAKAEYTEYLRIYPESEDTKRVNQRLTALITAADTPREQLKKGRRQAAREGSGWEIQAYGGLSQTYFRDETTPEDEETLVIRSDFSTDLDFFATASKGNYDLKTQFIGSYRADVRSGEEEDDSEFIPSIVSFEVRENELGLYASVGRQSRNTGGVLGRYDGAHLAYELSPSVTLNGVFGYPVKTSDKSQVNTDQEFYGMSVDLTSPSDKWDLNFFYITQNNEGVVDREAIGGEVRYFDPKQSFFTLVDYDILYSDLNIFLLVYNRKITESISANLVLDYRNSPLLTTTNAIQGQGVETLSELFNLFDEDELMLLANDRTSESTSATFGLTSQLNSRWQITGEISATEFGDTIASGGVEAIEGTGVEYLYATQLIASGLFYEYDSMILGLRYSDRFSSRIITLDGSWRVNTGGKLRVNPRLRIDYREDKFDDDKRWILKPSLRLDYRFRRWMKFEFDFGYEILDESTFGFDQKNNSYFLSMGYRGQF